MMAVSVTQVTYWGYPPCPGSPIVLLDTDGSL